MASTPIYAGSLNKSVLYALNSAHSSIVQADGTTAATSESHAIAIFGGSTNDAFIVTESFGAAADGGQITINNLDKKTTLAMVKHAGVNKAGAAATDIPELKSADGLKTIGGTSGGANSKNYLLLSYTKSSEEGKVDVYAAVVTVDPASAVFDTAADTWQQITATLNKVSAKQAITITNTLLDDEIVTVPGSPKTLEANAYFDVLEYDEAA